MKKETALIIHDFVSKQIEIQKILDAFNRNQWYEDGYERPNIVLERSGITIPYFAKQSMLSAIYGRLQQINEWMLIEIENETYGQETDRS